ncbi:MAG: hypothetical protein KDH96_09045 [Candidatus Riesia sp.]|nr:hypothetical protein [Candidatus Riesia sp.]
MINLLLNFKNYYWSFDEDDVLTCGGYINGILYGLIKFYINEDRLQIEETKKSETLDLLLSPRFYKNETVTYKNAIELSKRVREYLDNPDSKANQELNRDQLISNIDKLLTNVYTI